MVLEDSTNTHNYEPTGRAATVARVCLGYAQVIVKTT